MYCYRETHLYLSTTTTARLSIFCVCLGFLSTIAFLHHISSQHHRHEQGTNQDEQLNKLTSSKSLNNLLHQPVYYTRCTRNQHTCETAQTQHASTTCTNRENNTLMNDSMSCYRFSLPHAPKIWNQKQVPKLQEVIEKLAPKTTHSTECPAFIYTILICYDESFSSKLTRLISSNEGSSKLCCPFMLCCVPVPNSPVLGTL